MTQGSGGAERRKQRRVPMRFPVRVQGRESDGKTWEEMSFCEDASAGGVGLKLNRPVVLGQVLHLSMSLPQKFRQYDLTDPSYRVYKLVRNVRPLPGGGVRVGLLFIGKQTPRGTESRPGELFGFVTDRKASLFERGGTRDRPHWQGRESWSSDHRWSHCSAGTYPS